MCCRGDGDEQGDVLGIPFGAPGKCSSVTIGIIFGNLSHQCAQIVGGTADLFGLVRRVIDISHHAGAPRARLALKSRIVLSFLIQKEGKREEKEMIDFPDPGGPPAARGCQVAKPPICRLYEPEQGVDPKSDTYVSLWISYPQSKPQMFAGDKDNETSALGTTTGILHSPSYIYICTRSRVSLF